MTLFFLLLYNDNMNNNSSVSDMVNMLIIMGKYHIHCSKWRDPKFSFECFINDLKMYKCN